MVDMSETQKKKGAVRIEGQIVDWSKRRRVGSARELGVGSWWPGKSGASASASAHPFFHRFIAASSAASAAASRTYSDHTL